MEEEETSKSCFPLKPQVRDFVANNLPSIVSRVECKTSGHCDLSYGLAGYNKATRQSWPLVLSKGAFHKPRLSPLLFCDYKEVTEMQWTSNACVHVWVCWLSFSLLESKTD